jgi:hypothetical protein
MARKIGEHYDANGIRETWWDNGDGNVTVQRSQDAQHAADLVSTVNAEGVPTHDGLGKPVAEMPQIVWMDYCAPSCSAPTTWTMSSSAVLPSIIASSTTTPSRFTPSNERHHQL